MLQRHLGKMPFRWRPYRILVLASHCPHPPRRFEAPHAAAVFKGCVHRRRDWGSAQGIVAIDHSQCLREEVDDDTIAI